jgi:hypothetical protein
MRKICMVWDYTRTDSGMHVGRVSPPGCTSIRIATILGYE